MVKIERSTNVWMIIGIRIPFVFQTKKPVIDPKRDIITIPIMPEGKPAIKQGNQKAKFRERQQLLCPDLSLLERERVSLFYAGGKI